MTAKSLCTGPCRDFGGLGQEEILHPALQDVPTLSCSDKSHLSPPKNAAECPTPAPPLQSMLDTSPAPGGQGRFLGAFQAFPGSFDLHLYFHIKETLELHSLPSSARGMLPGNGHCPDPGGASLMLFQAAPAPPDQHGEKQSPPGFEVGFSWWKRRYLEEEMDG